MEFLFTNGATTLIEVVRVLEKEKEELKNAMLLINNDLVRKLKLSIDENTPKVKGIEELVWKQDGETLAIIDLEWSTSKCRKVYRIVVDGKVLFLENNNTFPIKTVILQ